MSKIIMYHYVRSYSKKFPYFNFLHKEDFLKQLKYFKKKNLLSKNENFDDLIKKNKILLSFDDGLQDHYYVYKKLLKFNIKGIFFISSYPLIYNDFLDTHKVHLILGCFKLAEIMRALNFFKIKIRFDKLALKEKNYQIKSTKNSNEKKKILIKIYLNFHLKNNKNKIIKNLFNYFFSKKKQKKIFKNFYLNKTQIKEMRKNGMIIGGHSFSHKLLSNLDFKTQKIEINKNVKHLNKIIKYSMAYFAFPYGGKVCFDKNTIKILKNNNIDYIFNTGNKSFSKNFKNFNDIPRYNCNKFKYGKIFKYQS